MPTKAEYFKKFDELLSSVHAPIEADSIYSNFKVDSKTIKKHLRLYLDENTSAIGRVIGIYPSSDTVIRIAETICGRVSGANVSIINVECKRIIDEITLPKHAAFLATFFDQFADPVTAQVCIDKTKVISFLYEEYVGFVHEADNGLVSIAGTLNEKILIQGLRNIGLIEDKDFRKTGKNSEADLQVEHSGATTKILFCEVKSYAARERLLRGLQDIKSNEKVGVGFFKNPAEFNPERTTTLLDAHPRAIYMPNDTHSKLHRDSARQTTAQQDRLYRPLSDFFTDMRFFVKNGALPKY